MSFVFNKLECEFLSDELGLEFNSDKEYNFTKDDLFKLRDQIADIEGQEAPDGDDEISLRGKLAVNIYNYLGGFGRSYEEIYSQYDTYAPTESALVQQ